MRINLGLIGCGRIARLVHLSSIKNLGDVRLSAVSDTDSGCANAAAKAVPGAKVYGDYRGLLGSEDIDAVIICLPTFLHAEAASEAFSHEKHVYLPEKPLAQNNAAAQALEAVEQERARRRGHSTSASTRYKDEGENRLRYGRRHKLRQDGIRPSSRGLPEWKRKRATGGGVLLDSPRITRTPRDTCSA
ncbi:MAG: Gfo/Idh/MocA family oxidoreductase [Thermodesulfobacteriota bacterium]